MCMCVCVCVYKFVYHLYITAKSNNDVSTCRSISHVTYTSSMYMCLYMRVYVRLSISCTSLPPSLPSSLPPSQPLSPSLLSFCNRTCSWKSISDFSKQSNFSPPSIPGYSQPVCVRAYVCCVMRVRLRGRACARMWDMCTHADRQRRGTPLARSTHLR